MSVTMKGVSHRFPGTPELFSGLDAVLRPGEVYAVTGPSGCGKSTLLGLIAGWITPTGGSIVRENVRRVRWVFQNPHGIAHRSAVDHVVTPLLARGRRRRDALSDALALLGDVGLGARAGSEFRHLSGGEAQRLMLARALAGEPDLLLVDEPTAQLDPRTAAEVTGVLTTLAGRSAVVVIATHDARVSAACTEGIELG
jgi:ABC-type lipoprotein export system ATPase subunit